LIECSLLLRRLGYYDLWREPLVADISQAIRKQVAEEGGVAKKYLGTLAYVTINPHNVSMQKEFLEYRRSMIRAGAGWRIGVPLLYGPLE
jgi:hypothetical protein